MQLKLKPWTRVGAFPDKYGGMLKWFALLGGVCLLITMIYTTVDVGGRYLANKPLPATWELGKILLVFIVFLSLAYTQALGEHIRLGFILERCGPRGRAILDAFCFFIGIAFTALIAWQAWDYTLVAWQTSERMEGIWRMPYFPGRLGLTIGMFFFCIQYIIDFIRRINQLLKMGKVGERR